MTGSNSQFASLTFKVAAKRWYEDQKPRWKSSTAASYRQYIRRLNRYFAGLRLQEINIHHLREYQKINSALSNNGRPPLVASSINHDLDTLMRILSRADLCSTITRFYRHLPVPTWSPPRVLSEAEEDRFFRIASSNSAFTIAYWVSSLTNNTSASGSELRKIQLKHVDLSSDPALLRVPSETSRNPRRERLIPLNETGLMQVKRILTRARELGCTQPEHYLFPFRRQNGTYDPGLPASPWFIYRQWNKLVDAALVQGAIRIRIKPYDLRYNVIAKMLRAGAPEHTVKSIVGHIKEQMLEHYSRQRLQEKERVLDMLNPRSEGT